MGDLFLDVSTRLMGQEYHRINPDEGAPFMQIAENEFPVSFLFSGPDARGLTSAQIHTIGRVEQKSPIGEFLWQPFPSGDDLAITHEGRITYGIVRIRIFGRETEHCFFLELVPSRLSLDLFDQMRRDIAHMADGLVFDWRHPEGIRLRSRDSVRAAFSAAAARRQLENDWDVLRTTLRRIGKHPYLDMRPPLPGQPAPPGDPQDDMDDAFPRETTDSYENRLVQTGVRRLLRNYPEFLR